MRVTDPRNPPATWPLGAHVYIVTDADGCVHSVHRTLDGAFTEVNRRIAVAKEPIALYVDVEPVWDDGEVPCDRVSDTSAMSRTQPMARTCVHGLPHHEHCGECEFSRAL